MSDIERTTFDNGLTVVSEYMPQVRSVALGAWVRSASIHEPRRLMGVSHMLEHMVFKGTAHRAAREIALSLERLGGSLDAYTTREHTAFQARVLDEHLEVAADVLGDLIFTPALRDDDLALERKVVLEEIAMVEDTPDDVVFELHNELLWDDHELGYSILGTRDTVGALSGDDLRALHRQAYQPQHVVVSAAGHVEHQELIDCLVKTGWAAIPRGDAPRAATTPIPTPVPRRRHVERDTAQTHVVLGGGTLAYGDPRRYAMTLASVVVGGGMSSRLFQRIREELGLVYATYTFHSYYAACGMHGVYLATSPDTQVKALDAARVELADVSRHGLTNEEVATGKGQLKGQITLSLESPSSRLYRAAATELYGEPFRGLDEVLALIEAITPDDVAAVTRSFFDPDQLTVLTLGPGAGAD
jgi:predicted Zn-dependent peptidase